MSACAQYLCCAADSVGSHIDENPNLAVRLVDHALCELIESRLKESQELLREEFLSELNTLRAQIAALNSHLLQTAPIDNSMQHSSSPVAASELSLQFHLESDSSLTKLSGDQCDAAHQLAVTSTGMGRSHLQSNYAQEPETNSTFGVPKISSLSMDSLAEFVDRRTAMIVPGLVGRRISETPSNFHQVVVFYCFQPERPAWKKLAWLGAGSLVVLLQLTSIIIFWQSSHSASCTSNRGCLEGQFCFGYGNQFEECWFCDPYARHYTNTTNSTEYCFKLHFADAMQQKLQNRVCDACISHEVHEHAPHPKDEWEEKSHSSFATERIESITPGQRISLAFAACVICMEGFSEIRDVIMCQFMIREMPGYGGKYTVWQATLELLIVLRKFFITVPLVAMVVPDVVTFRGAAIYDVFLNTVAVLFVLQIDNGIYMFLMPEDVKMEVETFGRYPLDHTFLRYLSRSRICFCCFLFVSVFVGTLVRYQDSIDGSINAALETDDTFLFRDTLILTNPFIFEIVNMCFVGGVSTHKAKSCLAFSCRFFMSFVLYTLVPLLFTSAEEVPIEKKET